MTKDPRVEPVSKFCADLGFNCVLKLTFKDNKKQNIPVRPEKFATLFLKIADEADPLRQDAENLKILAFEDLKEVAKMAAELSFYDQDLAEKAQKALEKAGVK